MDVVLYFFSLGLVILNTVFLYQYKIKSILHADIDREEEVLKVKWVSHMILAFLTPFFIFVLNQENNYNLLRFNSKLDVISLVTFSCILFLVHQIMLKPTFIDFTTHVMRKGL